MVIIIVIIIMIIIIYKKIICSSDKKYFRCYIEKLRIKPRVLFSPSKEK